MAPRTVTVPAQFFHESAGTGRELSEASKVGWAGVSDGPGLEL